MRNNLTQPNPTQPNPIICILIYEYEVGLGLNNHQWLICHKPNEPNIFYTIFLHLLRKISTVSSLTSHHLILQFYEWSIFALTQFDLKAFFGVGFGKKFSFSLQVYSSYPYPGHLVCILFILSLEVSIQLFSFLFFF